MGSHSDLFAVGWLRRFGITLVVATAVIAIAVPVPASSVVDEPTTTLDAADGGNPDRLATVQRLEKATDLATARVAGSDAAFRSQTAATATAPLCFGEVATIVGTNAAETIEGTSGADVIVARGGGDTIRGLGGDDLICGDGGNDLILAGGGSDTVDGGPGADDIRGGKGSDILIGSTGSDILRGGKGVDGLLGMGGKDNYYGDAGVDLAAFLAATAPVTVNLRVGSAYGEGADTLKGIESVAGSSYGDTIFGNNGFNVFWGLAGNDLIHGKKGHDVAMFTLAPARVVVHLKNGTATGEGVDTLKSIQSVVGSPFNDRITGTPWYNVLDGAEGVDTVYGLGGGDVCRAETVYGCLEVLPISLDPPNGANGVGLPGTVEDIPSDFIAGPPDAALRDEPPATTSAVIGGIACPIASGDAFLDLPDVYGRGYWYSEDFHSYEGWIGRFGPWMYYDNASWSFYYNDVWWGLPLIDVSRPLGFNFVDIFVRAWYYSYDTNTWYYLGQCRTVGIHSIPGVTWVAI